MDGDKSLIQQLKESGRTTEIKEAYLRTYYTCVRYIDMKVGTKDISYKNSQWSCIKDWYDVSRATFKGNLIESKVLNYCKFSDTEKALKKEIGEDFVLFTPK